MARLCAPDVRYAEVENQRDMHKINELRHQTTFPHFIERNVPYEGFTWREWAINLLLITSMFWAHSNTYYRWWRSCVTCRQRRRFQSFYILKEFSCLRLEDMKEVVKSYIALCEGFTKLTHLDSIVVSLFVNNETAVLSKNVWSLQQMAPDMCLR